MFEAKFGDDLYVNNSEIFDGNILKNMLLPQFNEVEFYKVDPTHQNLNYLTDISGVINTDEGLYHTR